MWIFQRSLKPILKEAEVGGIENNFLVLAGSQAEEGSRKPLCELGTGTIPTERLQERAQDRQLLSTSLAVQSVGAK